MCAHDVPVSMATAGRLGGEAEDRTRLGTFLRCVSVGQVHSRCACSQRVQIGLTSSHYEKGAMVYRSRYRGRSWVEECKSIRKETCCKGPRHRKGHVMTNLDLLAPTGETARLAARVPWTLLLGWWGIDGRRM